MVFALSCGGRPSQDEVSKFCRRADDVTASRLAREQRSSMVIQAGAESATLKTPGRHLVL